MFSKKWSAGKMTEDDRKKLFWYLKRKTSYTAWKRVAGAFDRFATIFEKQVREQPHADGYMEGTDWEPFYPEILKAQVLYEKALILLKQGDRSVFLYNERGIMRDASVIASSWHSDLVNHGFHGDHFFDGKYVEEMTVAIQEYFLARKDAYGTQPMMAEWTGPEWWGEALECTLNNEDFPRKPLPGWPAPEKMASYIQYPNPLPNVLIPNIEILIKTGDEIPVFGIYEPQVKDGCMNYLSATGPAPFLYSDKWGDISVTWKLLWEDTRYLDGEIPVEEDFYFPVEDKIKPPPLIIVSNDMLTAMTGQRCPKDGSWAVMDDLQGKLVLKSDDLMPQHKGRDVTWVWVA